MAGPPAPDPPPRPPRDHPGTTPGHQGAGSAVIHCTRPCTNALRRRCPAGAQVRKGKGVFLKSASKSAGGACYECPDVQCTRGFGSWKHHARPLDPPVGAPTTTTPTPLPSVSGFQRKQATSAEVHRASAVSCAFIPSVRALAL
jgi:hypothetical protein